jgi:hypothetical protein
MILAHCDGCREEVDMYTYLMRGGLQRKYYCEKCEKARETPPPPPTNTAA